MKIVRAYTGDDDESHLDITDQSDLDYVERDGTRTAVETATGAQFSLRKEGAFSDFHNAPRRQYVLYLTASVELGLGDGSTHVMEPGDVLLAEDTTGRGHSSRVIKGGISVTVRLDP
jgi:quercetin dioxygenase-like cupin family protein